jgi:hypothetical protein
VLRVSRDDDRYVEPRAWEPWERVMLDAFPQHRAREQRVARIGEYCEAPLLYAKLLVLRPGTGKRESTR